MNHDELQDLLGAYALDAVDPGERDAVEAHLRECGRCRAEVAEHREAATFLAHSGADAPDGVWDRIVDSLEAAPPDLRLVPAAGAGSAGAAERARRPWRRAVAVVGAAAAAAVIVLGVEIRQQDERIGELETALEDPITAAYRTALADPNARIIELAAADGTTTLRGAITEGGMGYLRAADLPQLGPGRTYQLWGGAADRLVSLGVIGDDPDVVTFRAGPYDVLAISEEPEPGVVAPTSTPVVQGALS